MSRAEGGSIYLGAQLRLLISIPGPGRLTAASLLAWLPLERLTTLRPSLSTWGLYRFRPWLALEATGRLGRDDGSDLRGVEAPRVRQAALQSDELTEART